MPSPHLTALPACKRWLAATTLALGASLLTGCNLTKQPDGEIQGLAGAAIAAERWASGLSRGEVDIEGFKVPYLKGGQGEPLILIHGFGGSKDNFNRVAKHLVKHYTVYAIDVPGFGASTRQPHASYLIDVQARRLHDVASKLGLKQVHLGGNSMGGWIAGRYAAQFPADVKSVWFLAPGGTVASRKSEVIQEFERSGKVVLAASNREEFQRVMDLVMFERPAFAPGFIVNALADRAIADKPLNDRIYGDFRKLTTSLPQTMQRSGYKGPALIVWGKNDRVLHPDGAAELHAAMADSDVILLDKVGHIPMMEKPAEVAADYVAWRQRRGL